MRNALLIISFLAIMVQLIGFSLFGVFVLIPFFALGLLLNTSLKRAAPNDTALGFYIKYFILLLVFVIIPVGMLALGAHFFFEGIAQRT